MQMFDAKLIEQWSGGRWLARRPAVLKGFSIDSRTLVPGNFFVAIRGERFDGHRFVRLAFAKGAAAAAVCEGTCPADLDGALLCVSDTGRALRDIAAAYRRRIGLSAIAVTGSIGKTTVKEMVADILSCRFVTARTLGNWNNDIGLPLSLLKMDPATRVGVFEMGTNHPGELMLLCKILRPDWALVTTIAPVHLEHFKSVDGILEEKASILKSLSPAGTAVLRSDAAYYPRLRALAPGRVITVALSGDADYRGIPADTWGGMAQIIERESGERCFFKMSLPGRHHLENALFAVAVGRAHGLGWDDIRRSLEKFCPQPMRWEVQTLNGITVVNDAYNANPVSMAAALRTFADMPALGRKWLVLAGMLELGAEENHAHEELGRLVARGAWRGLIGVGELGARIASAAEQAGLDAARIFRCPDHARAAQRLSRDTVPGDVVLFKASRGQRLELVLDLWRQQTTGKQ